MCSLLQSVIVLIMCSVTLALVSVLVPHWLLEGSALNVNQMHLVIQWLAVHVASVMSQAQHCVTPPLESVSVNHTILESRVVSVQLTPLMI